MSSSKDGHDAGVCPFDVSPAVMVQRWKALTFLHWRFDARVVQRLLPPGLEVETFDSDAWVALVPFHMTVGLPGLRAVPWLSRFLETNVRTYVRDVTSGHSGIWFFSLDAARLAPVVTARATYRLPYYWSHMRLHHTGPVVRYQSRRRWPGPSGARSDVTIRVREAIHTDDVTPLEHFLTARWVLFSVAGSRRRLARAWHVPWPLHRAEAMAVHDELVAAAGLPAPDGPPRVHYSPGVEVRIGLPEQPTAAT